MNDYFEKEILNLERELKNLKTSAQRSGGIVRVVSQTVHVSVNLEWEDISWPTGSARAEATYEVITDRNALIMPTLSWYDEDVFEPAFGTKREIRMQRGVLSNGNQSIYLYFIGSEQGEDSDAARTKRGETVAVTVDLTITSTQDFVIRKIV